MSADVLELELAQERKLHGLEEETRAAEWVRLEESATNSTLRAQRLATEGQELMKAMVRLCDDYWGTALAGRIRNIPAAVQRLRQRLDRAAVLLAHTLDLACDLGSAAEKLIPAVAKLAQEMPRHALWVEETLARWALLQRRPKPVDRAVIARAQEAFRRGEGEDVADVLARLKAGGPIVKE